VILATSPFAVFDAPAIQALVVGIALGAGVGKLVVRYRESRREAELPAPTVRRIEAAWIAFVAGAALAYQAITELS